MYSLAKLSLKGWLGVGRREEGSPVSLSGAFRATGMGFSSFTPKEGRGWPRPMEGKDCPEDT